MGEASKNISISLYNQSCFDYLKSIKKDSIDLILIDPPYEISRPSGYVNNSPDKVDYINKYGKHTIDFGDWDKDFVGLAEVIKECYRVLRKGGTLICFYDLWKLTTLKEYFDNAKFKQVRFIEWLKTNPVPLNSKLNYLTNTREIAVSGVKVSKPTFNSSYDNALYQYPICHDKGRFHPTQKPLKLIIDLVVKHSNEGDIILDCFSGSGTTAVAALQTNRNFTGCELNSDYHKKSIERLYEFKEESIEIIKEVQEREIT